MSVNSSSPNSVIFHCGDSIVAFYITTAFIVTRTLMHVPLSILVLYLAYQKWRQQRSFATASHSDIFTYHLAVMELISFTGAILYFSGRYSGFSEMLVVGYYTTSLIFPGQVLFNILTCVERYLAVVHPVIYLRLKQSSGLKIRNICIICVWLLSSLWSRMQLTVIHPIVQFICTLAFALIVISFCSSRVLCVLFRPGPGEVGGGRERVDQSKQRAFYTIMAIMGVLGLGFAGFMVCLGVESSPFVSYNDGCIIQTVGYWFVIPSYLVLPLLFLHRAGKLPRCH